LDRDGLLVHIESFISPVAVAAAHLDSLAAYERFRPSSAHPLQIVRLDFGSTLLALDWYFRSRIALAAIRQ
jgi:hypothetical protein